MSDRQSGILSAVSSPHTGWTSPFGYHRFCLRHVRSNFCSKFKDPVLKRLVWDAGSTCQIRKFDAIMDEIKNINPEARRNLDRIPREKWTLAHDGGRRYGILTTNCAEVFNSALRGARSLPITALVMLTFYRTVGYFNVRRGTAAEAISW